MLYFNQTKVQKFGNCIPKPFGKKDSGSVSSKRKEIIDYDNPKCS